MSDLVRRGASSNSLSEIHIQRFVEMADAAFLVSRQCYAGLLGGVQAFLDAYQIVGILIGDHAVGLAGDVTP